jgi:gentisate 1,2-dioxygenase
VSCLRLLLSYLVLNIDLPVSASFIISLFEDVNEQVKKRKKKKEDSDKEESEDVVPQKKKKIEKEYSLLPQKKKKEKRCIFHDLKTQDARKMWSILKKKWKG